MNLMRARPLKGDASVAHPWFRKYRALANLLLFCVIFLVWKLSGPSFLAKNPREVLVTDKKEVSDGLQHHFRTLSFAVAKI